MKEESWKDLWDVTRATTTQVRQEYIWKLKQRYGDTTYRFDRMYLHAPNENMHVEPVSMNVVRFNGEGSWGESTDHFPLRVQLRIVSDAHPPHVVHMGKTTALRDGKDSVGSSTLKPTSVGSSTSVPKISSASSSGTKRRQSAHTPVNVISIANRVESASQVFRALVAVCLNDEFTPEAVELTDQDPRVAWDALPKICGFKIKPGPRKQ